MKQKIVKQQKRLTKLSLFFKKINKTEKLLASLTMEKRTRMNKSRSERVEIVNTELQSFIRDYYEQRYTYKQDNLEKNRCISRHIQPTKTEPCRNMKSEQTNNKKIESVIKILSKKSSGAAELWVNSTKH